MHYFTRQNNLSILFAIGILSLTFIDAKPREKRNGDDSGVEVEAGDEAGDEDSEGIQTPCMDFSVVSQNGRPVGNCLSTDQTGMYWCYVEKTGGKEFKDPCPSDPDDAVKSHSFPDKCKTYKGCQVESNVHPWGSAVIKD